MCEKKAFCHIWTTNAYCSVYRNLLCSFIYSTMCIYSVSKQRRLWSDCSCMIWAFVARMCDKDPIPKLREHIIAQMPIMCPIDILCTQLVFWILENNSHGFFQGLCPFFDPFKWQFGRHVVINDTVDLWISRDGMQTITRKRWMFVGTTRSPEFVKIHVYLILETISQYRSIVLENSG